MKTTIKSTLMMLFATSLALVTTTMRADSTSAAGSLVQTGIFASQSLGPAGSSQYGTNNTQSDTLDDTCFNAPASPNNISGADAVSNPNGNQSNPYSFVLKNSGLGLLVTTGGPSWATAATAITTPSSTQQNYTVPYSGYYYVSLTMTLLQSQANPVYFWVDDYATYGTSSYRLLYSGDVPYTLNGSTGSTFTITLTGGAYLPANSTILSPRIWTTATDPISGNPTQFCVMNTCSSSTTPACTSAVTSTLSATLFKMP